MAYSPASQKRYNEKNSTMIAVKLHNENDADIIEYIKKMTDSGISKQAFIKQIIRKQIELEKPTEK